MGVFLVVWDMGSSLFKGYPRILGDMGMYSRSRWIKTKVSLETYEKLQEYAKRHGLSIYAAARRLIEEALKGSYDLMRLVEDEYVLLMALRVRVLKNPSFKDKVIDALR